MATLQPHTEDGSEASSSGSGSSSGSRSRSSSGSSLGSSSSGGDTASSGAEEASASAAARALVLERDPAAADAFERLAIECPLYRAKTVSAAERDRRALCESSLTYGEILFEPFETALRKIKHLYGGLARPGGTFVDVGSGSGKAVFAAALLHEWESLHGIEVRRARRAPTGPCARAAPLAAPPSPTSRAFRAPSFPALLPARRSWRACTQCPMSCC